MRNGGFSVSAVKHRSGLQLLYYIPSTLVFNPSSKQGHQSTSEIEGNLQLRRKAHSCLSGSFSSALLVMVVMRLAANFRLLTCGESASGCG